MTETIQSLTVLVSRLDAAHKKVTDAAGLVGAAYALPDEEWEHRVQVQREAREAYEDAFRALWTAVGGRF